MQAASTACVSLNSESRTNQTTEASAVIALALVVAVLRADTALDRLHPAFSRMQFGCLVGCLRRLMALFGHVRVLWIELLPGLHFAVMRLFLRQQLLRPGQCLCRRGLAWSCLPCRCLADRGNSFGFSRP